jgi:hypothetical protein
MKNRILYNLFNAGRNQVELLSVPSGFRWTPAFNIFRNGNSYSSDFDPTDFDFTPSITYYFNQTTGLDANDGLTPSTPKRNIRTVVTALNSSPPANGATFILQTDYDDAFGFNNTTVNFKLAIKSDSTTKRILSRRITDAVVNLVSGNVYSATRTSIREPLDLTFLNEYGKPRRLTSVVSISACQALPGSFFQQSGVVNFHLWDSRAPDSNVRYQRSERLLTPTVSGCYFENIIFWGNDTTAILLDINSSAAFNVTFNNCEIGYGTNSLMVDIGNSATVNDARIYLKNLQIYEGLSDGINVHNFAGGATSNLSPYVFEENVIAHNNGKSWGGTSPNNNGTSMHDGGVSIRLNCVYRYNENRQIHDVRGTSLIPTQSWMLNCEAGNSRNQSAAADSIAYNLGQNAGTQGVEIWMDGCRRSGGSLTDLRVNTGSVLRHRNMNFTGWTNVLNGTFTTY